MNEQPARETFFGGCPHDCPDTCSMLFEVEDGKLIGVRGNPDHPMTRGGLCVKLKDYETPTTTPTACSIHCGASGPKGSKQFERITWDEALDEIVSRWKGIIAEHGPQAIMPYSYLGNQGLVHGLNGGRRLLQPAGLRPSASAPSAAKAHARRGCSRSGRPPVSTRKATSIPSTS